MQITTQTIIKSLPYEESFKNDLLANLDRYGTEQRYQITKIVWDTFFALYRYKLEDNLENALAEVEQGKRKISPDLYKAVEEQTAKEMENELVKTTTKVDLDETRRKLEELMQGTGIS